MKYIVAIIPSVILIFLGVSVKYFKAYWLISGYNTMSQERKKNVDEKSLGDMTGNLCFILAVLIFAFILSLTLGLTVITIISALMFVVSIIFFLVKAQRFDRGAVEKSGEFKKRTRIMTGIVAVFLVLVLGGVGILLYQSSLPVSYSIYGDSFKIEGLYGETINFSDIKNIYIKDQMPNVITRINGAAIGDTLKGYFDVDRMGNVKLFINTKIQSFIFIETENETIILNDKDKAVTEQLFEKLQEAMGYDKAS